MLHTDEPMLRTDEPMLHTDDPMLRTDDPITSSTGRGAALRAPSRVAMAAAACLVVAACGGEPDEPPETDTATDVEPLDPGTGDGPVDASDPPEPTGPTDEQGTDGQATEEGDVDVEPELDEQRSTDGTEDEPDDGVQPLAGDRSVEPTEDEGDGFGGAVTGVRLATHDGFDRVVVDVEGEAVPGWFTRYEDAAISDPSGEPIEMGGDAFLTLAIRNMTLPPELPDDLEPWQEDRIDGPSGGVVVEVVDDAVFEGQHRLVLGVDEERPYTVDRFEDPMRVVIDVFHDE